VVQRQALYLGEINDNQRELWRKSIEVFEHGRSGPRTVVLFAEDQTAPVDHEQVIQVRLKDLKVDNRAVARRIRSKNGKHGKFSRTLDEFLIKHFHLPTIETINGLFGPRLASGPAPRCYQPKTPLQSKRCSFSPISDTTRSGEIRLYSWRGACYTDKNSVDLPA
jgi:hypothetical protein